ncbi:MAG: FHA domain-containing protein [Thermoguttaceae bacterium]|jgi:hypothetical protein
MARSLDFGESTENVGQQAKGPSAPCNGIWLVRHCAGKQITTHVLPTAVAAFGRSSDREVCLRVEPTDLPANREKTFHISINHGLLRYIGDRVEIIDTHSTNGTSLKSVGRLQPGLAVPLSDGDVISVADALTLQVEFGRRSKPLPPDDGMAAQLDAKKDDAEWLNDHLIGREKPGILDYVRLRRLDNFSEEEYVLLFGGGNIGHSGAPLIPLDADAVALPHVRTLDLGDAAPDYPAALYWAGKAIHLLCNVADQVRINGTAISAGEDRVLSGGETIEVLGQSIQVVAMP